ncbi:hypothetical protein BS17DRAFT_781493 [Gyrodon lividus]|nr:hypothetical protein BS17DRAFT_781493 [Gyrodon lividus]
MTYHRTYQFILLYGVLIVQTFIYHTRFSKDSKWIKIYVWILFGLETLSLAFALYGMLQGASFHCLSCIPLYDDVFVFSILDWSFEGISILTGLISFMAHGFYCWRIRVMGHSWYIPVFVMLTSMVQCILLVLGTAHSGPSARGAMELWISDIWMIASFMCDLIITIETTRLLFRRGGTSSFKDTRDLVTKLIRLTIETGAVTTAAMLLQFVLSWLNSRTQTGDDYSPFTPAYQLAIFYSISRLYANCLLATLNARLVISKDSTRVHQASTILFDVPPRTSPLVSERQPPSYVHVTTTQSQLDMGPLMDSHDDAECASVGGTENQEGASRV